MCLSSLFSSWLIPSCSPFSLSSSFHMNFLSLYFFSYRSLFVFILLPFLFFYPCSSSSLPSCLSSYSPLSDSFIYFLTFIFPPHFFIISSDFSHLPPIPHRVSHLLSLPSCLSSFSPLSNSFICLPASFFLLISLLFHLICLISLPSPIVFLLRAAYTLPPFPSCLVDAQPHRTW